MRGASALILADSTHVTSVRMNHSAKQELAKLVGHALALHRAKNLVAAEELYKQVLVIKPDHGDALNLYGCLSDELEKSDQAVELLHKAVACNPAAYPYFYNLGNVLSKQRRLEEAIASYQTAIRLKPDYAVAYNNLGRALSKKGDSEGARSSYLSAVRCGGAYADPHFNLGVEFESEANLDGALASYRKAVAIRHDYAEAHFSLARVLTILNRYYEAAVHYQSAAKLEPMNPIVLTNLGNVLLKAGKQDEATQSFRDALCLNPLDVFAHSNMILAASYISANPEDMATQSLKWGQAHSAPYCAAIRQHENVPEIERTLRLGYVSADFRHHAAAYWIEPLLMGHQQSVVDVFCYSNNAQCDDVTIRMKAYVKEWVDITALDDDKTAERIRQDKIDILVDLSGHTNGHRLLVFARQPAPVQVSWFGFPVSTGVETIQYRFTDAIMDPPNRNDAFYSEKLIYLPQFYAAFRPESSTPLEKGTPLARKGFVTFASLNSFAKISTNTLECWADIVLATPGSHILIQAAGLEESAMAVAVRDVFDHCGVAAHRVELRGWCRIEEFLALGKEIDIALDSFPFNGGVTTFQTLWMGVPVVTLSGRSAASRVGHSILHTIELDELVAETVSQYQEIAIALASDADRMAQLRATLRDRVLASGLLDGTRLAQTAEHAYRQLWRKWCLA